MAPSLRARERLLPSFCFWSSLAQASGQCEATSWGTVLAPAATRAAELGGRLVVATQSGHDIPHEQPELVLDAIRDVVLAVRAGDLVPH